MHCLLNVELNSVRTGLNANIGLTAVHRQNEYTRPWPRNGLYLSKDSVDDN